MAVQLDTGTLDARRAEVIARNKSSSADPAVARPRGYGKQFSNDGKARRHGVDGEALTPFVRAAMAVDVTASLANFGMSGLGFINADYTMVLSRLRDGPFIGMASLTHYSDARVAVSTASMFDRIGTIGNGVSTAIANPNFSPAGKQP